MPDFRRAGRLALWVSGALWVGSWTIICLEVFRWHHMSADLRFTPPPAPPGVRSHPGLPVLAACLCACSAPPAFIGLLVGRYRRRAAEPSPRI